MDSFYVLDRKAVGKSVHPRCLQGHGGFIGPLSFVSQDHELRPPMVRVHLQCDEFLFVQIIDDPLNVLTIRTQVASEPCDRLRPIRLGNGAEGESQRALVKPSPATSLSPAVSILLLSLNRSRMRSVNAVPPGALFVLAICHHEVLLTS